MVVTPFSIAYLLFSVATGYFKAYAMFAGLIGTKKSKSWTVTQKFGNKVRCCMLAAADTHRSGMIALGSAVIVSQWRLVSSWF